MVTAAEISILIKDNLQKKTILCLIHKKSQKCNKKQFKSVQTFPMIGWTLSTVGAKADPELWIYIQEDNGTNAVVLFMCCYLNRSVRQQKHNRYIANMTICLLQTITFIASLMFLVQAAPLKDAGKVWVNNTTE